MAQADCSYRFRLIVVDEEGEILNNTKVKFRGRDLRKDKVTNAYTFSTLNGCGSRLKGLLKVSARKFDKFKEEIEVTGSFESYKLELKNTDSENALNLKELSVVTGKIKNKINKAIPNTKVILIAENGKRIETLSNENGYYRLDVESGNYTLEIIGEESFTPKKIENYKLDKGYNHFDITLDVFEDINTDIVEKDKINK